MNQTLQGHSSRLLVYAFPAASLLLNWWAASLFMISLISGCLSSLYGLMTETPSVWISLIIALASGVFLHSVLIAVALTIAVTAEQTC